MATTVIMPLLGEAVIEGTIAAWLKKPGDAIALYEPLLEIETDKVTTEATAEVAGTLLKILVPAGETVEVGTVLALIGEAGEEVSDDYETSAALTSVGEVEGPIPFPTKSPDSHLAVPPSNGPSGGSAGEYSGRISPVVGRIAQEHQVDLSSIEGTGREGRITKRDILSYIELRDGDQVSATIPKPSPEQSMTPAAATGPKAIPGDLLPLTSIRRAIADHMVRSKQTSPHVTTVFEIDCSNVASHRMANKEIFARDGTNLTFTTYIISAVVQALKIHPIVNSSWSDEGIRIKKEINIGMATAIDDGLIVPVIRDAANLSLLGLSQAVNDLSHRARINKLLPDEVQGGTFTLTNHGISGSLFATPIINQPQCAILGMGKIEKRVKVINDAIAIRLMAYASLTFDHRILDGATADRFMAAFAYVIENWD